MTKSTTKAKPAAKESAPLIVLGYDENHKPQAAQFPAANADLVTKAARLMDLKVYEAAAETGPPWPRNCRLAGFTATVAALCLTSGKACTARSSQRSSSNLRPRWAKTKTTCPFDRPAPDLGRDRAWPSRHRPGGPGIRLVGSHRARSEWRHAHAAVSGLPEAAQVCSPSHGGRVDEPSG